MFVARRESSHSLMPTHMRSTSNNRKETNMSTPTARTEKYLRGLLVSPGKKPEPVSIPVGSARETLDFVERVVGRSFKFFHDFQEGLALVFNNDVERYYEEEPCRALYATNHHVGRTIDLYEWDEEWTFVKKAGDVFGVINGDFLVVARSLDEEMNYVSRSMTDAELAEVEEVFSDESTGRLETLKKELGTII